MVLWKNSDQLTNGYPSNGPEGEKCPSASGLLDQMWEVVYVGPDVRGGLCASGIRCEKNPPPRGMHDDFIDGVPRIRFT